MAGHAETTHQAMIWLENNWLWLLIVVWFCGGIVLSIVTDVLTAILTPFVMLFGGAKHKREMDRLRLQLKIEKARKQGDGTTAVAEKDPGPCKHRDVVSIRGNDGEVKGWLCKKPGCPFGYDGTERLPPDWAVDEKDL